MRPHGRRFDDACTSSGGGLRHDSPSDLPEKEPASDPPAVGLRPPELWEDAFVVFSRQAHGHPLPQPREVIHPGEDG